MITKVSAATISLPDLLASCRLTYYIQPPELRVVLPGRPQQRLAAAYLRRVLPRQKADDGVQALLGGGC